MRRCFAWGAVLLLIASGSPASSFERELARYRQALAYVCQTGVTPHLVKLYEEAVRAMDAGHYGGGRDSNFAGVRPPYFAYRDCYSFPRR